MGVTYIAPAGTVTSPAKLITKNITDNGTYDAADDLANGYSQVVVNVEGGGGSSDFSTAEVTITNSTGGTLPFIIMQNVVEENDLGEGIPAVLCNYIYTIGSSKEVVMPLYKGGAIWQKGEELFDYEVSLSGSVEQIGGAVYYITGDCTINIAE